MIDMTDTRVRAIAAHFDVNVAMSDEVPKYIQSLSTEDREKVRLEYKHRLDKKLLGSAEFRRSTSCKARDERAAQKFFKAVYAYAFEGGEEPDVTDYWNR